MKRIIDYSPLLQSGIRSFIKDKARTVSPEIPWGADFLDRLLRFSGGGKMLRGSLVCFSYAMFSGKPPGREVLKVAIALELTHSALLIHDDIIDKDETRRGYPSMHRQYHSLADRQAMSGGSHFGASMAICGADATLFLAFELLAEVKSKTQISNTVNRLFTDQMALVCAGQMQDIYLQASATMPTKKTIFSLMRSKTAAYTLELPLIMGAALASQPPATINTLKSIGSAAGTIFQIRDDELGVMGNAKKLGKPIGSDIKEGKKTLVYYYLMQACNQADRALLGSIFSNPDATTNDIKKVQEIVRQYDITKRLNQEIDRLKTQALEDVARLDVSKQAKTELEDLVDFCASRQT